MTEIVMKDGAVLFVGTAVAGDEACCCGCSCPACDAGVSIELNAGPSSFSGCAAGTYNAGQAGLGENNTHGFMEASMYCEPDPESPQGIIWRVSAFSSYANFGLPDKPLFGLFCNKFYSGTVQADENCLPVAGAVSLTLDSTEDGGACGSVVSPTVTVVRA